MVGYAVLAGVLAAALVSLGASSTPMVLSAALILFAALYYPRSVMIAMSGLGTVLFVWVASRTAGDFRHEVEAIVVGSVALVVTTEVLRRLAVAHDKSLQAVQRQSDEVAALYTTTLGMLNRLELDDLPEAILTRAAELAGTSDAYLGIAEANGSELVIRAATGRVTAYIGRRYRHGESLTGKVWETGEPLVIQDYDAWSGRLPDYGWIKVAMAVPLRSEDRVLGVIGLVYAEAGRAVRQDGYYPP